MTEPGEHGNIFGRFQISCVDATLTDQGIFAKIILFFQSQFL